MSIKTISSHKDWCAPSVKSSRGTYITCEVTAAYNRCCKTRCHSAKTCRKLCECWGEALPAAKYCCCRNIPNARSVLQIPHALGFPPLLYPQSFTNIQTFSTVALKERFKSAADLAWSNWFHRARCRALYKGRSTHALRVMECWTLSLQLGCEMVRGISTLLVWDQPSHRPLLQHSTVVGRARSFIEGERWCFKDKRLWEEVLRKVFAVSRHLVLLYKLKCCFPPWGEFWSKI